MWTLDSLLRRFLSASHVELRCLSQGPEHKEDQTSSASWASQHEDSRSEKAEDMWTLLFRSASHVYKESTPTSGCNWILIISV